MERLRVLIMASIILSGGNWNSGCTAPSPATRPAASAPTSNQSPHWALEMTIEDWNRDLLRYKAGDPISKLTESLQGKYRELDYVHWGGTGARTAIYQIDDLVDISVHIDCEGTMQTLPVASRHQPWLRSPYGGGLIPTRSDDARP